MKNPICLAIPAILIVSASSLSRPAIAQIAPTAETAPTTEILPTPTTPKASQFVKSAAIGTIEVSPETKAEFQVPLQQQLPVAAITLPENTSSNFIERLFASLGSPATSTAKPTVQPGQFDAGPNRGVKFFRGEI